MDFSNISELPIEVREHILAHVKDITLIPDGLSETFWKKWFLQNSVDFILFADWEKSVKIMKVLSRLDVKRKPIAVLDWSQMYVGTIADITIGKSYAEYVIKKEIIVASGETGLCMLVEPVNFEAESHLDIWAQPSLMQKEYTGEFSYAGYVNKNEKKPRKCSPGVTAWFQNEYDSNFDFYNILLTIFKIYNIDFVKKRSDFDSDEEEEYDKYEEFRNGFQNINEDYGDCGQLPILSQSLIFTRDPLIFRKSHKIKKISRKDKICTVEDSNGQLIAFIACIFTREDAINLLCNRDLLCYFISSLGNIYFEKNNIYKL